MEPSRQKSICLPFESEAQYRRVVEDKVMFRQFIQASIAQYPELLPREIALGFRLHGSYYSTKQDIVVRRIKLRASGQVFQIRPSLVMPDMSAKTDEIEKALYWRHWGVPFAALAYVFGRDAMFWYRAWLALGRASLLGTTDKHAESMPLDLVADEKVTWGGTRSLSRRRSAAAVSWASVWFRRPTATGWRRACRRQAGYGEFAAEADDVFPDYQPRSVCTDGLKATRPAWRRLFPQITLVLCFLHSILKIKDRCTGALRHLVLDKAWHVYEATTRRQFAQRTRRLAQWATAHLKDPLLEAVLKLCRHRADFTPADECPSAARISNAVDRLLNHRDRVLYAMRYGHSTTPSTWLAVRAWAMQWNFHPYGTRLRHDQPWRSSPFHDLNGFQYHANWLHNFLIASSMGGLRL
ncbi:MAG: hypothetical protein HY314_00170 [Acidobacteria bacterium]|nr:hypothetical protein [Acidobacteriota bacterium]